MRFVGVDLARGGRRPSGVAVLDPEGRVVAEGWTTSDGELSGFLEAHDHDGAVVALDAPLMVRNPAGTGRGCEAELQRRYGRLRAGPYPTNLGLLGGRVRAMELVERSSRPYLTVPRDPGRRTGWWAVEVFPAAALVELGRLEELRGAALKAVEDLADAHVCAHVGLWWWTHGPAATLVAGDDATGAILVPRP